MSEDFSDAITTASDGCGLLVRIRVQPGASRDGIGPPVPLPNGPAITVRVCAPAIDGRANARVIALLAKSWRIPKSRVTLVSGSKNRLKTISVTGDPGALRVLLTAWLRQLPASKGERTT